MPIEWISREEADAAGLEEDQVLLEQTPEHYPEFYAFVKREIDRAGGDLFFRGGSGAIYRLGKIGQNNPDRLHGIEICARVGRGGQTLAGEAIDLDLWPVMEWIIEGVGGEWSVAALRTTGAIYRVPGAPERA